MLKFAMFIALLALVGVVYGFATGFKDAANPEGTRATPALDGDAAQARRQRARRTMWGSAIVFILVALWYGFIYESPEDRAERIANKDIKDRKSTRLNSSHVAISYAVFCLKKKKKHLQSN